MKVIILAGGRGTRLAEETRLIPKPMIEVGGIPILVHIMKIYHRYGFREFVIACGYKGRVIKEYFSNFLLAHSDWAISLKDGATRVDTTQAPDWDVTLVDTGLNSMTAGRVKRLAKYIGNEPFMVTYGDGVGNIDISALLARHRSAGRLATITAVCPPARFGSLALRGDLITEFSEKVQERVSWINGGFMVFEPGVLDHISGDEASLERDVLEDLAARRQLTAHRHEGFWQPMDTLRDKELLESLWNRGEAPWVAPKVR